MDDFLEQILPCLLLIDNQLLLQLDELLLEDALPDIQRDVLRVDRLALVVEDVLLHIQLLDVSLDEPLGDYLELAFEPLLSLRPPVLGLLCFLSIENFLKIIEPLLQNKSIIVLDFLDI